MSGESASRSILGLPGNQLDLVKAIQKTRKPIIVILTNGRPLTIPWLDEHVDGLLETWMLGTESGHAIADVLFGDYNPSGKLPITFPRNTGQIPIYYNHLNTGRPYVEGNRYTTRYDDVPNSPLYPFGYGLSYTDFEYTKPTVSTDSINRGQDIQVDVEIKNQGSVIGTEIVQLYISDKIASISPVVRKLRGFKRVSLAPGESQKLTFTLNEKDLAFYNKDMDFVAEPGEFDIYVGSNLNTENKVSFWLRN